MEAAFRANCVRQPGGEGHPGTLQVVGCVKAPSPGHQVHLELAEPQGANPKDLLLKLALVGLPGDWPNVETDIAGGYEQAGCDYESVTITGDASCQIKTIADIG